MNLSIVIPSFNRKDDLERCINSILSQNYEDYEIIIVDNGSKVPILVQVKQETKH